MSVVAAHRDIGAAKEVLEKKHGAEKARIKQLSLGFLSVPPIRRWQEDKEDDEGVWRQDDGQRGIGEARTRETDGRRWRGACGRRKTSESSQVWDVRGE